MHQMSTSYFGSTTTYQRETSGRPVFIHVDFFFFFNKKLLTYRVCNINMLIVKDVHEEEPSSTVEEMEPKTQQDQTSVNEERLKEPNDGA